MLRALLGLLILFPSFLIAQESPFSNFKISDFQVEYQHLDSQANAIVINEIGRSRIQVVESERGVRLLHDYSVRIKILNKEGFDKANFTIPLYKIGDNFEYIQQIRGVTYNLENGRMVIANLDKKQVFNEKYSEFTQLSKFTFPDIREGSVIELHYTLISPNLFNYRTWHFHDDIPKLNSQYTAEIPANYTYNVTLVGHYKLTDQKSDLLKECFTFNGLRIDCSKLTYILKDIPAFVEEDYMLAPKNYLSAIRFELVSFQDGRGANHKYTKEWKDVDRELLNDKDFGGQLKKTSAFKNILPEIIADSLTQIDKAKAVFYYVKKQIKWDNYHESYARNGVEDALAKRSGNVGDINISLVAGLSAAGIEAYPVLLSTRTNGLPNSLHPVISDFNYLVALAIIDGKQYLLDATEKNIPFGELPLRAINHNGRVIYSRKSSDWLPMVNNTVSKTIYNFNGELSLDGTIKGNLVISYAGLDALAKRNEVNKYNSDEEYMEYYQSHMPSMQIVKMQLANVSEVEKNLTFVMDVNFKLYNDSLPKFSEININGILFDRITKNPFNLDDRSYPVDLGAKQDKILFCVIKIPTQFQLKDKPKDIALSIPDKGARYTFKTEIDENNNMTVIQNIALLKSVYDVEQYFYLKEFYSRIIQQQKLELTFKKINE